MSVGIVALLPLIGDIISKVIPDPTKAAEAQKELLSQAMNAESELYKAAGSIITAEAKGESWMQRNWRPITMLSFVFIIVNNYILVPYVQFLSGMFGYFVEIPTLEITEGMWGLLSVGVGGYVASRGVEKTVQMVQRGGVPIFSGKAKAATPEDLDRHRKDLLTELRNVQ